MHCTMHCCNISHWVIAKKKERNCYSRTRRYFELSSTSLETCAGIFHSLYTPDDYGYIICQLNARECMRSQSKRSLGNINSLYLPGLDTIQFLINESSKMYKYYSSRLLRKFLKSIHLNTITNFNPTFSKKLSRYSWTLMAWQTQATFPEKGDLFTFIKQKTRWIFLRCVTLEKFTGDSNSFHPNITFIRGNARWRSQISETTQYPPLQNYNFFSA